MSFLEELHKPDILDCISHLSSDEVFTPPKLVNEILDTLPQELFTNPDTKFLDPCCKSGVFLREIAKRLIDGLADKIPDLDKRVEHIFKNQLFGLAITELTAMLSRRSVYCSKDASCEFSVTHFENPDGNIEYKRTYHLWLKDKCMMCGASKAEYDRGEELETHAYSFIHTDMQRNSALFKRLRDMKFDVIIGNPPYQLSDGGHGASAMPIYHLFIQQAKRLNPRYLTMIVPARWFTGGRGLDSFRDEMLKDTRIRVLHDFPDASTCFPGVEIKGGVCYFLWTRDSMGKCNITTHLKDTLNIKSERYLLEEGLNIFIRDSRQIDIMRKVQDKNEPLLIDMMTANDPFGYDVRVENSYKRVKPDFTTTKFEGALEFFYYGWREKGIGYINKNTVRKGHQYINSYKVFIPRAWGTGNTSTDRLNAFIGKPLSVCTETYAAIAPLRNMQEATNVISYINTKFFHFLVSIVKITQAAAKHVYRLVPIQDFNEEWTDEKLYKKYGLTQEEIDFIESMIRPME